MDGDLLNRLARGGIRLCVLPQKTGYEAGLSNSDGEYYLWRSGDTPVDAVNNAMRAFDGQADPEPDMDDLLA